tara:strand:+ start:341 stop:595 length:255 start_codon:yes stop_codon:yes gene_type:complete
MQVKFTIDYDLIELVDAIGLDYDIVDAKSDVIDNYKEIEIMIDEVEYFIDNVDDYNRLSDDELCEFLLNPTLCEGLIYTQRIHD